MKKLRCPDCNQSWIICVYVPALRKRIYVCDECETTWMTQDGIVGNEQPVNFVHFLRANGLKGEWSEVEKLPADDENHP